ncbi:UNVERIFIED_ORG: uncharacterized membrane protein YoaK (UPF0700 family) [Paenarthrobacter nicotinovorans]|uniref:hypothetical protein n=1 Tax=Paenarthrobacter histidinolovorans TaxID=43664 RepID=UPI00166DF891|nr:hypothetical protein [Paenarthrobacter histidinolovorans]GGJ41549.1 hypothetical protein GCM10010052_43390 [Paenarthrobacter histidinolovorans]
MDYNHLERILFCVLAAAPAVLLVIAGALIHAKLSRRWMHRYLVAGILGCIAFFAFGGTVALAIFPPPYDAYFAGGRGLDLRGTGLVAGAWIGAVVGGVATLGTFAVSAFLVRRRTRKAGLEDSARALRSGAGPDGAEP